MQDNYGGENMELMEDYEFGKIILNSSISEQSKKTYAKSLKLFCEYVGKTYTEIVNEIKEEQYDRIEDNKIIRYNPNEGIVNRYITGFLNHYREKGNKESTLSIKEKHIRTCLKKSEIILPSIYINHRNNQGKKNILTRKDIGYVIEHSNIHHKALISFAGSTGLRVSDLWTLTIEDFMENTREYHDYYDVDEFIEKAPYGMIGFWKLIPHKTENINLECRVCNTPESSDYILDSLTERKDFLEKKGLKLELDDALFSSRNKGFKGFYSQTSLSPLFTLKNKMLFEYRKKELDKQYEEHLLSRKEYREALENIPKFHAHALRHFFTTTVRNYTTNRDVSLIMEGHTSPYKMDSHYVGKNDEMFSDDMIKETYKKIINCLTFNLKIDPKEYQELLITRKNYEEQLEVNQDLQKKYEYLNDMVDEIITAQNKGVWGRIKDDLVL